MPKPAKSASNALLELDKPDIELDDLKWVVMMVLFNVPGSENAYQQMEELVFDESTASSTDSPVPRW